MKPRINYVHKVNDGLFTDYVKAVKVTTSGSLDQIERKFRQRASRNRRLAEAAQA